VTTVSLVVEEEAMVMLVVMQAVELVE